MNSHRELFVAASADDLAREAAVRFVGFAAEAIRDRGRFAVALSGGSTPRRLYQLLTQAPYLQTIDWSRVHLFLADERFVPHTDADSTARLINETLMAGTSIPPQNFHAMPTEGGTPEVCALEYARTLDEFFGPANADMDLMLLGMGPDGHTASLFPGRPDQPGRVAVVHESPKPPPVRLTLTLNALCQARHVVFLVTGADKAPTIKAVFDSAQQGAEQLPAARVHGSDGKSAWLVDRDAAADLGLN